YGQGPNGNPGMFHGWNPFEFNCGGIAFSPVSSTPMALSMGTGGWTAGCYGRWRYHAPGSAYVFEMDLAGMFHNSSTGMAVFYGILNGDGSSPGGGTYLNGNDPPVDSQPAAEWGALNNVARRVCTTGFDNNGALCPSSTGNAGNFAYFGLYNNVSKYYPATQASWVYGTTLYLGDRVAPARPTFSGIPASGWVRAGSSFGVAATQGGIGLTALTVNFAAGGYSSNRLNIGCDRSYAPPYAPCPQNAGRTITVPANAEEGAGKSLSATASTYELTSLTGSRTVNIDRSGPVIDLGGRLPPRAVTTAEPDNTLTEPYYSLTVDATDGDPAGANSARRSGLASIEIKVDGQRKHYVDQGCTTHSCPLSTSWQFVSDEYSQGEHRIEVIAVDHVGNSTTETRHVRVDHRIGRLEHYGFDERQLDARTTVAVNVGNGNLLVNGIDRQYTDMTSFYAFERFFNSREPSGGPVGRGWKLGRGTGVRLQFGFDGAIGLRGPSGYVAFFQDQPDGAYTAPRGLDQTLTANTDGTYTVDDREADRQLLFSAAGVLTAEVLPQGARVDYAYAGDRLASATDGLGRKTTFTYDGAGYLDAMVEHSGAAHRYDPDAGGSLKRYTAPDGGVTGYTYAEGDLTKITHANGLTSISYDTQGRVASVVDGEASDSSAPRTTYAYSATAAPCDAARDVGKTVVTNPDVGVHGVSWC
ncbi:MAG: hypothetical protein MSC31_19330, partial [Solirubrobacteraceae bacterium MAG38_C4-C5]|nr:hypothetical protein [Candidatus Siliceabacter maunaloa]